MTIERLREAVAARCEYNVLYIDESKAADFHLSYNSPANVYDETTIYILDNIEMNKKLQAEAHELGHLYVNKLGIIKCDIDGMEPIDFLKLEFNNALSHKPLMDILENDFNISNEYHIELRLKGLDFYNELDDLESEVLYGLGLRLYDISRTVPAVSKEINEILNRNNEVKESYILAMQLLNEIHIDTSREEQILRSTAYINNLGLDAGKFSFI